MKKYKLILILMLLFAFGLNICFPISAETIDPEYYAELLQEKKEYLEDREYRPSGADVFSIYTPLNSPPLTVLLYTDIGSTLTIERGYSEGGDVVAAESTWFMFVGEDGAEYLRCKEIDEAAKLWKTGSYSAMEARSALRECVKYFDISKEELLQAYKTMEENPDAIRPLLSCLSDKEYESAKSANGTFGRKPVDFMVEALYIEDDALAHRLLCDVYSVYVKEFGCVITAYEVFHTWPEEEVYEIETEEMEKCDLTGEEFAEFFAYCKKASIPNMEGADHEAALQKLAYLESVREAQLKAAQTGDSAVSALWVIALALPALTVVAVKRKRRI